MNPTKIPRIIYNDDSGTLRYITPPHSEEKITRAIDYLKGTQVDCLVWCVGEQMAFTYPSEKGESFFGKQKNFDSKVFPNHKDLMFGLYQKGIDYLPRLIKECRQAKLSFVASFRMNDTHVKSDPHGLLASNFWQTHQHFRLWDATDAKSYYNAALDYSFPDVRNLYLTMIEEVANRYDVDGIELDFCRTPYYFQPSEAWEKRNILTDFVADVRRILKEAEKKKGREILLVGRVPFGENRLKKAGMDLESWFAKKLVDILVMSNLSNDYSLEIEPWLTLARKNNVLFYPSIESDPSTYNRYFYELVSNPVAPAHNFNTPKIPGLTANRVRAMAQQFLSQKPDGIYMFNYPCILNERKNNRYNDPATFKLLTKPLSQLGSIATLKGTTKDYLYWPKCPISVETGRPAKYHQTISFSLLDPDVENKNAKVILRFREIAEKNPHATGNYQQNHIIPADRIKYGINNTVVSEKYIKRTKKTRGRILSGFVLKTHQLVEISVPFGMLVCGENQISFEIPGFPEARDPYVYIYELEVRLHT